MRLTRRRPPSNVFVLGTGRCGTTTFVRACEHLTNWSAGHETLAHQIGDARFAYPRRHIEADNRLSWFLGDLGRRYPDALYVHLTRDPEKVVASFLRRWGRGIIQAFTHGIVMGAAYDESDRAEACRMYVDTVTANIEAFLAGRNHVTVKLEDVAVDFPRFLDRVGAEGDLDKAMREWLTAHNAS
jgi:hypothetical protein